MNYIFPSVLIFVLACQGARQGNDPQTTREKPAIARVNDIYLYPEDIKSLVPPTASAADSARIVKEYVDVWVKKQLLMARARTALNFDEAAIERKVQDYKYALMVHEFETHYINQHLDKQVSQEAIIKYYETKSDNFVLRQNIVRCLFAAIHREAPQVKAFEKTMRAYPNANLEEIQSFCSRFASNSSLDTDLWLNFDEVIASTPWNGLKNKAAFLKNHSFVSSSDSAYYYFIRLLDYKVSGQVAPMAYVKDDIEGILINKKKVKLKQELVENTYRLAEENHEFEIY